MTRNGRRSAQRASTRSTRPPVAAIGAAVLAVVLVLGGIGAGALAHAGSGSAARAAADAPGTVRVLTGRAYGEYLLAQQGLGVLPPGRAWPVGVPAQSGYGSVGGGLLRPGSGTDAANFTYLCVWESEMLVAYWLGQWDRVGRADRAISRFFDSAWARRVSPDGVWAAAVSLPVRDGNFAGVKFDRTGTCRRAGLGAG